MRPACSQQTLQQVQHYSQHLLTLVCDAGRGRGNSSSCGQQAIRRSFTRLNTPPHRLTLVCDAGKREGGQAFMRPACGEEILHQTQHSSLHLLTLVCDAGKREGGQAFMRPACGQEILHQTQHSSPPTYLGMLCREGGGAAGVHAASMWSGDPPPDSTLLPTPTHLGIRCGEEGGRAGVHAASMWSGDPPPDSTLLPTPTHLGM
jgi:hypothetical protein